jgi:hypothetical protein
LGIFSQKHLVTLPAEYTPVTIDQTSFWGRAKAESFSHFSLLQNFHYSTSRYMISMVRTNQIWSFQTIGSFWKKSRNLSIIFLQFVLLQNEFNDMQMLNHTQDLKRESI